MERGQSIRTGLQREQRLHQLIELAMHYRGWSRKKLAESLDRHVTKLYPRGGNPKLDLVVQLSAILEWPVEAVIDFIWFEVVDAIQDRVEADFETLDTMTLEAFRKGKFARMQDLARRAYAVATSPEHRALACNRQAGAWGSLGLYNKSLEAIRRGLRESPISNSLRMMLQANLAHELYSLGEITEARGITQLVIEWFENHPPSGRRDLGSSAFAHYLRAHTYERLLDGECDSASNLENATLARLDFLRAYGIFSALYKEYEDDQTGGLANTCRGGIIEAETDMKIRDPNDAVAEMMEGLDNVVTAEEWPISDLLESYGWWCVFGANIALRHQVGREQQQNIAIFTNKGQDIANRLDNWIMRERVLSLEYKFHQLLKSKLEYDIDFVIDREDLRMITGAAGRFPQFRTLGWKILQTAKVVDEK